MARPCTLQTGRSPRIAFLQWLNFSCFGDSRGANAMKAEGLLLQAYDESVTIQKTFRPTRRMTLRIATEILEFTARAS